MAAKASQIDPFGEHIGEVDAAAEAEELGGETGVIEAAPEAEAPAEKPAEAPAEAAPDRSPIPYNRFQEVNEQRRKAEQEASDLRERWARAEERQKVIREASEEAQRMAQQAQGPQRPDASIDPVGAELFDLKAAREQDQQMMQQLQSQLQNFGQNYQQTQEQAQFSNWVQYAAQQYQQQDPEYTAKATFCAQKRMEVWQGLGATPQVAREIVEKESVMIAQLARQNNQNFAPVIAQLAAAWGYQSPNGNGHVAPAQNGTAQQRLNQVANGQKVQGISRIPAAGPGQASRIENMTLAELADMPQAQLERLKSTPEGLRALAMAYGNAEGIDPDEMMAVLKAR